MESGAIMLDSLETSYIQIEEETGARRGKLLSLQAITMILPPYETREIRPGFLEVVLAIFFAWKDLQERRGDILPHLPSLLADCNFQLDLEFRDSRDQVQAISNVVDVFGQTFVDDGSDSIPFAIFGNHDPRAIRAVSTLAGSGMGILQTTGVAGSTLLDGLPLFSRTIGTNEPLAQAVIAHFKAFKVRRFAILYIDTPDAQLAAELKGFLQSQARANGMTAIPVPMRPLSPPEMLQAILNLKNTQAKYVVTLLSEAFMQPVARMAYQHNILGNAEYSWLWLGRSSLASPGFGFDRLTEPDLALAFHGSSTMVGNYPPSPTFNAAFQQFAASPQLQAEFISKISNPEVQTFFQNNFTFPPLPIFTPQNILSYDAILTLGLAACQTPGNFTGSQLYRHLVTSTFQGLSGNISFDPLTGGPAESRTGFEVINIVLSDERSDNATFRYRIAGRGQVVGSSGHDNSTVQMQSPIVFFDNRTNPPPDLPPLLDYTYNLVPLGAQIFAWCLMGLVMATSIGLMIWTFVNRHKFVVSASQPIFLIQLNIGTLIMASTIIPLSMQGTESTPALDAACKSVPWIFCLGTVIAMSAILSKTWRIGQLMDGSNNMKRVKVEPQDVAAPFCLMMIWNVIWLTIWTVVAPRTYQRVPVDNWDIYGRSTESYGICKSDNSKRERLFVMLILAADLCGLAFVAFQCYKVRTLSTYFAETHSLAWTMISMLETAIVFGPLLLALRQDPTGYFLTVSSMITVLCFAVLLPIFGFKIYNQNADYRDAKKDEQQKKDLKLLAVALDSGGGEEEDGSNCSVPGRMSIHRNGSNKSIKSERFSGMNVVGKPTKSVSRLSSGVVQKSAASLPPSSQESLPRESGATVWSDEAKEPIS